MFGIGSSEMVVFLVLFVGLGLIGAHIAASKGRDVVGWFFLSAFFLWIPIVVLLLLPQAKQVPGKVRECSACKEFVKWQATVCKHCGTDLSLQGGSSTPRSVDDLAA